MPGTAGPDRTRSAFCARWNLEPIYTETQCGFLVVDGGIPEPDDDEADLNTQLAGQLAEGEVAVLMKIGHEKLRYFVAYADVIRADGKRPTFNLESLAMATAHDWNPKATSVFY